MKVVKQWKWLLIAENCVRVHGSTLCLSSLYHQGLPIVLSPPGLISKAALLHSDCENVCNHSLSCFIPEVCLENMGVSCAFMF